MATLPPFLLLLLLLLVGAQAGLPASRQAEVTALLSFKDGLDGADTLLPTWGLPNASSLCSAWEGVVCSASGYVTALNFSEFNLNGTLTAPLCDLPFLTTLDVRFNNFNQTFPSFLLQSCQQLQILDLSQCFFYGPLPSNISNLRNLTFLSLESNSFQGPVPPQFGDLPNLTLLRLRGNMLLSGPIPPHLGNLSSLQTLDLAYSSFSPAPIPPELGNLSNLQILVLESCNLVDTIPSSLANLRQLSFLHLAVNNLSGPIPSSLMQLSNLTHFYLFQNQLSGSIPSSLFFNMPHLLQLDFSNNFLQGPIPQNVANLVSLQLFQLHDNSMNGTIPNQLTELPNLNIVLLYHNSFTGNIPFNWGNFSSLQHFDLSNNQFTGPIPPYLCKHNALLYLALQQNQLTGEIPTNYDSCSSVSRFVVSHNFLSGAVPSNLWSLQNLTYLMLRNNSLSGEIALINERNAVIMEVLQIDDNQFDGTIPANIGMYGSLSKFTASGNKLSGPLPAEIGSLSALSYLDLSNNSIDGQIPDTIGNCKRLASLYLERNRLTGPIPSQLSQINVLSSLDVSYNRLSGSIPTDLARSNFNRFNVSYNNLSGPVPEPLGADFPSSFEGNPGLCLLQACQLLGGTRNRSSIEFNLVLLALLGVFPAALCFAIGAVLYKKRTASMDDADWKLISFQRINFKEDNLLPGLDEKNLIGSGGSGKVYRVVIPGGRVVAVKKLLRANSNHRQGGDHAWKAEIEILGKIKHRNIVKLLCSCARDDAKLLVYEYMPNGSLGDLLHRSNTGVLNWRTRLRIAFGAAQGLEYLHHDCVPRILHRDVKSNNILIDAEYVAKLADFGAAKESVGSGTVTRVVGSIGYIAPEYASTLKVNEKSDVYSYGVVLLELLTGKCPIVEEFEGLDLVRWVGHQAQSKESIMKVFDQRIVEEGDKESMLMVLRVALLCIEVLPQRRPSMREVVEYLRQAVPSDEDDVYYRIQHKQFSIVM